MPLELLRQLKPQCGALNKLWNDDFDFKQKSFDIPYSKLEVLTEPKCEQERGEGAAPRGFADFHNHWDGILPVEPIIQIYQHEHPGVQVWEQQLFPAATAAIARNPITLDTLEWMFLRGSAAIFEHLVRPVGGNGAPDWGVHVAQHVVIYTWWWAYLLGVRDPSVNWGPANFADLRQSTLNVIGDLYVNCVASDLAGGNPLRELYARAALRKYLRATKTAPFDDAYVGRAAYLSAPANQQPLVSRRAFDDATVLHLVDNERIGYLQVSQPPRKIPDVDARVNAHNAEAPPQRRINVRWLALLSSQHGFMDLPGRDFEMSAVAGDLATCLTAINGDVAPGRVIGVDWAGPECKEFRLGPAIKLVRHTLDGLHTLAANLGRTVLFRPHVGEGTAVLDAGRSLAESEPHVLIELLRAKFESTVEYLGTHPHDVSAWGRLLGHQLVRDVLRHSDDTFQTVVGRAYDEASRRATNNVGTLLEAIQQYYIAVPGPRSQVKIRFGHATHTTSQQALVMAALGIAADINMSSNLRTGALSYMASLDEADVWSVLFQNWSWNPLALLNHSIRRLCEANAIVVLGTDGQGVELSSIRLEYLLASYVLTPRQFARVAGGNIAHQSL